LSPVSKSPQPPTVLFSLVQRAATQRSNAAQPAHHPPPATFSLSRRPLTPTGEPHLSSLSSRPSPSRTQVRVRAALARTPSHLGPHAKASPLAYLRPPPPPSRPSRNPSRPMHPRRASETLARCCRSSSSLPLRRQEVVPELHKKVKMPPVLLVIDLVVRRT
jgi:hypothetical protein